MDTILGFVQNLLSFLKEGKAAQIIAIVRDFIGKFLPAA